MNPVGEGAWIIKIPNHWVSSRNYVTNCPISKRAGKQNLPKIKHLLDNVNHVNISNLKSQMYFQEQSCYSDVQQGCS